MNCAKAQQAVLLAQSGELAAKRQSALEDHLAACPTCRAYQADLSRMVTVSRDTPLDEQVSEFTLRRIEAAAARSLHPSGERRDAGALLEIWRPALISGAAACLLLLLALTFIRRDSVDVAQSPPPESPEPSPELLAWDVSFDEEFASLNSLLAMSVEDTGTAENGDSLDTLAEELIELESWSI